MENLEFKEFPKIARFSREIIITEKIDGTNAQILIEESGEIKTGSRTRWITPENDNYGFAKWVNENKELVLKLGVGRHFGEWWGQGIQRGYGLKEKRFSLFNTVRWCEFGDEPKRILKQDPRIEKYQDILPEGISLVPEIYRGNFLTSEIDFSIDILKRIGSYASKGFMNPEGIIIFHTAGNVAFKKTIEKDNIPKSFK